MKNNNLGEMGYLMGWAN